MSDLTTSLTLHCRLAVLATLAFAAISAAQAPCTFAAVDHVEDTIQWPFGPTHASDCEVAVGTDRILTCSNSGLRLLDKNGVVIPNFPGPTGPIDAQARLGDDPPPSAAFPFFFPCNAPQVEGNNFKVVDPMVYFDYEHSRFWVVAVEIEFDTTIFRWIYSHVHVAVSASATPANWDALTLTNPTGAWRKYDYCLRDVGGCQDIEGVAHNQTIAVDGDTLYISMHDDEFPVVQQRRTTLMMLDKDELMAGIQAAPQFLHLENEPNGETEGHVVAVEYDAWNNTQPVYTVAAGNSPGSGLPQDTILVGAITKTGLMFEYDSIPLTGADLPPWFDPSSVALAPEGAQVTLILRTFLHATYRPDPLVGGRIWTCAHIREASGGQPVPGNFVRYFEIHTNGWPNSGQNPTLAWYADIDLRGQGLETYDPSIAVDAVGNVALSWTQSGETLYPQFWMGAKRPFDPPGVLGETRLIASSTTTHLPLQTIDYSGIDPDPTVGCRFWGHSGLAQSDSLWQTHVGVLCLNGCADFDYADQDGNRVYDALDTVVFTSRFQAQDRRADCNRDTELDILDFLCFNDLLEAGRRRGR